ncbi:sodium:proton antiporter [Chloroflexales bacterium ZM16-3]|nr:sodium:proton antiporter [Chloroflexales bacterium ZM16-3]
MSEHALVSVAGILVLGVGAQWLASRLRLPSILMLLLFGFIAGPVTGWIDPEHLFGDLLFPLVSLAVGVILFEGGLSLQFSELRAVGGAVRNLVTLGATITWAICTAAAMLIFGFSFSLAALLGAILVVTGPTVIGPLLRFVRPSGSVNAILKWEGIVIDPIGATMAVLVFEAVRASGPEMAAMLVISGIAITLVVGVVVGALTAGLLVLCLRRYWIPDNLQSPVTLMLVAGAFALSNTLQHESGLLTVTLMGVILANQRLVSIRHIVEFKETLTVLLIAGLFIVLTARLKLSDITGLGLESLAFLAVVILIVRPVAAFLSTMGFGMKLGERAFIAWMAPRGIVAASVASIFALRLAEAGVPDAERLAPITFMVIVGTVLVYSLTAVPVARRLGVAQPDPQGVLIVGAHQLGRALGVALKGLGLRVLLVDSNPANVAAAERAGLSAERGNILSDELMESLNLGGIGRLLALTQNDEVNTLAATHFAPIFGRKQVFQLQPRGEAQPGKVAIPHHLQGRLLFWPELTHTALTQQLARGGEIRVTTLAARAGGGFQSPEGRRATPLLLVGEGGALQIGATDLPLSPRPGQRAVVLIEAADLAPRPPELDAAPA